MADDFDLCAILKSFSTTLATNNNYNITEEDRRPIPPAFPPFISQQNDLLPNNMASFEELPESYNSFVPFSQPINPNIINPNITPTPCLSANVSNIPPQPPPPKKPRPYYYRRKKTLPSKVVEVAAEDLLAVDPWCWRKYGQKPIKGSPHPRSYYKCSSDTTKCPARKHVERSQTDPSVFVVSYEGEHTHSLPTHRNPLSGSSRINKWESGTDTDTSSSPPIIPTLAPTSSATTLAPCPESGKKVCEDDQEVVMISNLAVGPTEDIYMGIRELGGGGY